MNVFFLLSLSLCSLFFAPEQLTAMNNNATATKIAEIHRDYDTIKANGPSLNKTNPSPVEDIEIYIAECQFLSQEADNCGEIEIACDLKKKIGQASNFIDKLMQD